MSLGRLDVYDYDGIIALVDLASYNSYLSERWDLEMLLGHLVAEMNARHAVVWRSSEEGGDEWVVEFRKVASPAVAKREFTATIDVTRGRLYLVNYTDLTMAAEQSDIRLPLRLGEEWFVELANGSYSVTVRQLFDPAIDLAAENGPSFELVCVRTSSMALPPVEQVPWWSS